MYPVFVTIPFPLGAIPLLPWLLLVAVMSSGIALLGWRAGRLELVATASVAACCAAASAIVLRHRTFVPADFTVSCFGLSLAVSLAVGWRVVSRLAAADGHPRAVVARVIVPVVVFGFVGARVGYLVENSAALTSLAAGADVRAGGLNAYGAFLLGIGALVATLRKGPVKALALADAFAPAAMVGELVTRMGCYLLGSGFGRPLGSWAPSWLASLGTFPRWSPDVFGGAGAPAWVHHVRLGLIPADAPHSLPVHPTQLYLAVAAGLVLTMALLVRRWRTASGEVFLVVVFGYGLGRFVIGMVRDDPQRLLVGPHFSVSAALGLGLVLLAAAFVLGPARSIRRPRYRLVAQVLALVLPATALALVEYKPRLIQLSLGQWIGLATAVAAGLAWGRRWADTPGADARPGRASSE